MDNMAFTTEHRKDQHLTSKARQTREFALSEIICTSTLYHYVDKGLMSIKNLNLHEKSRKNTKKHRDHKNRIILGKSIEDYDSETIAMFADLVSGLLKKFLGYATPDELFDAEMDVAFATQA